MDIDVIGVHTNGYPEYQKHQQYVQAVKVPTGTNPEKTKPNNKSDQSNTTGHDTQTYGL